MPITRESLELLGQPVYDQAALAEDQRREEADRRAREVAEHAEAERQRQAELAKAAEAEAEAERLRTEQQEADQAIRDAGTEAVIQMLVTDGSDLDAAKEAKTALDLAMADDSADASILFARWSEYRRANAQYIGAVGEGRYFVSMMRGTPIQRPTDALEDTPFATILDQAVAMRVAGDRVQFAAKVQAVATAAQQAAIDAQAMAAAKPTRKAAKA